MAGKIGVYFDQSNIGGGLDAEALAQGVRDKWGSLAAVVKVVPVLAEAVDGIKADIAAEGLDGLLLCGASPRVDADLYRFSPHDGTPVQVEHVNLREQCVLAYRDPDGASVLGLPPGDAPELLRLMATDYVNMGMVRLSKTETPEPATGPGTRRILVIGGGWTGMHAAMEAAASGYEVVLVEKSDKLGGAANNIPVSSPL
ncbi:MAG: FAD-dependent oxidoreductase, partial [Desulfovibrio sp.]|nr:FAD-dependent oxidoreductase [Desulfovibrio sp.]